MKVTKYSRGTCSPMAVFLIERVLCRFMYTTECPGNKFWGERGPSDGSVPTKSQGSCLCAVGTVPFNTPQYCYPSGSAAK